MLKNFKVLFPNQKELYIFQADFVKHYYMRKNMGGQGKK